MADNGSKGVCVIASLALPDGIARRVRTKYARHVMSCPGLGRRRGAKGGCHSHKNLSDRPIASDLNLSFFLSDPTKDSDIAASLALASLTLLEQ